MKRFLLVIASLFALSLTASAQFGIMAGFTLPTDNPSVKAIEQFHAGITGNIKLPLGFGIQPSLIYAVKESAFSNAEDLIKTGYIELPVQVQWGIGKKETFRAFVMAEPFIGLAVYRPDKEKLDMNSFEVGAGLGLGIICFKHLEIMARYVWNLGTLSDLTSTNIHLNNSNGVQITTAVLF